MINWIRFLPYVGLVIGSLAIYGIIRHNAVEDYKVKIERQNVDAGKMADDSANNWRTCVESGGVYHYDSGNCERP